MKVELVKKNETTPVPSKREAEITLETKEQCADTKRSASHESFNTAEIFAYYGP